MMEAESQVVHINHILHPDAAELSSLKKKTEIWNPPQIEHQGWIRKVEGGGFQGRVREGDVPFSYLAYSKALFAVQQGNAATVIGTMEMPVCD